MTLGKLLSVYRGIANKSQVLFNDRYLIWTTTTVSVGLYGAGDLLAQHLQVKKKKMKGLDTVRSGKVAAAGFIIGPFIHYWYMYLDRIFPGRCFRIVTKKVVIDQVICSPIVIALYLYTTSLFEKKSLSDINREILPKSIALFIAELPIWPPAQYFSFFFLPTKYRGVYDNIISFGYDTLFSYVKFDADLGWIKTEKEKHDSYSDVCVEDKIDSLKSL
ncbi:mpv17-like protein 2 [Saccostrea echinata]|uniref:mpv17-like protein 2 n=1 Tax=Saccostrea echinata TaxID=191078 RepID=UPI002A8212D0|nr:mpv17-like protein 2 [Saccostrea echinata]XP_061197710.1 mpv17-like protein 2 [Saccostrea echinata]